MDDPYHCRNCRAAFDSDLSLLENENRSGHRLPVSCKNCPYSVCHRCYSGWFQTWAGALKHQNDPIINTITSSLECPECHASDGFDALKPNISPFTCMLLQEAQSKQPADTSSGGHGSATTTTMVTPTRPTPPARCSASVASTMKREADESTQQDSKQPAAKKQRKTAKKKRKEPSIVLTEVERETLLFADKEKWFKDMEYWLEHVDGVSKANSRTVMSKVKKLASNEGISYVQWPPNVFFYKGIEVNLSMDFDRLLQEAKAFEDTYGEDKGHGWLMRHPIGKLGQYQHYVVVEKLRKGLQWPVENGGREEPAPSDKPGLLVGKKIYKDFGECGWWWGRIERYTKEAGYHVYYPEDSDEEDLTPEEIVIWVEAAEQKEEEDGVE